MLMIISIFSARLFYLFDFEKKVYRKSATGIGFYNKEKNTFKIIETLRDLPITDKNLVEVSLMKGKHCGGSIHVEFFESSNKSQGPNNSVLSAFNAVFNKIN